MTAKYTPEEFAEVFWSYVDRTDGCWLWTGKIDRRGYGKTNRGRLAHRVAYELSVGPIPDGLQIDHVVARGCTNHNCVNPAHLEPVTNAENMRRRSEAQTHCKHGHEFTPENTYTLNRRNGWIGRMCRTCNLAAQRRYKARKAAQPKTETKGDGRG